MTVHLNWMSLISERSGFAGSGARSDGQNTGFRASETGREGIRENGKKPLKNRVNTRNTE
jgi:hypothetical protein